jgi:hypothetical protein
MKRRREIFGELVTLQDAVVQRVSQLLEGATLRNGREISRPVLADS